MGGVNNKAAGVNDVIHTQVLHHPSVTGAEGLGPTGERYELMK